MAISPRVISALESSVVVVLPLVIPAALSAFTYFTARSGTSVKPEAGAVSRLRFRALATKMAASTRLILS